MDRQQGRKPLISGRGFLRIEDFCRSTGLDPATVEDLASSGRLEGVLWTEQQPRRLVGIFDDVLPSQRALAGLGLAVRDDYDPEALRSFELFGDEDPDDE